MVDSNKIKEIWKSITPKIKISFILIMLAASVMIIYTVIYAFSIHGMSEFFKWVLYARLIVVVMIIFAISLPILFFLDFVIASKRNKTIRVPSRALWIMALIGLIAPIGLQSWVRINWSIRYGDSPAQLIIMDGKGTNELPNLAIVYYSKAARIDTFQYGPGALTTSITDEEKTNNHVYVFENLLPDTEYWYKINDDEVKTFRTPRGIQNQLKFAFASDPHIGGATSENDITLQIINTIADPARKNEFFLCAGDLVDLGFVDTDWVKGIKQITNLTSKIPTRTAVGNHDAMFGGDKFYLDYFYPENLPVENGTQFYQRFDVSGVHFLVLDVEWGTGTYFGAQEAWLKAQLNDINSTDPNGWIVVMSHSYYYASGTYAAGTPWFDNQETIKTLVPLFESYDVDLVLSGHIHDMQYLEKENVTYAVMGSMGSLLEPDPDTDSAADLLFLDNKKYGFMEVEIMGSLANITIFDEKANLLFNRTIWN